MFDVTSYGAVGDGTTDDRAAIQSAIDACEAAGGGVVYFPRGTYLLDSAHPIVTNVSLLIDDDYVTLEGEGRGLSIVKLGDNHAIALINFQATLGGGVQNLEINGNRQNQTGNGHAIRSGDSVTSLTLRNLYIHDIASYGIGLQFGTMKDVLIENVLIEDTGADGIDIKNPNQNNRNNRMSNVTVRRAGLRTDLSGQACIDIRGIWNLNNIICEDYNNTTNRCNAGIRFRAAAAEMPNTAGHNSTLTNFYIKGTSADTCNGITASSFQVTIAGGQIHDCTNGILFNNVENIVNGVIAKGCDQGFYLDTGSERTILSGCMARECSNGFYVVSDQNSIDGLQARGCVNGINLQSASQYTALSGVTSGNTGNNLLVKPGATWTNGGLVS